MASANANHKWISTMSLSNKDINQYNLSYKIETLIVNL
jgi:hypothetical protein